MMRGSDTIATGGGNEKSEHSRDKVSVVVPLFNGGSFIEQTVQGILGQTHENLEVVVVDDGSTDGGVEVVRRLLADQRVSLVLKPHLGIAGTRNAGLAWTDSSSAFVLFLDQDDSLEADLIEGLVRRLAARPDAVGAHAIADFIDGSGCPSGGGTFAELMRTRRRLQGGRFVALRPDSDVVWPEIFPANNLYPPGAVLLRRRAVIAVGGFDPRYAVADDWDLMLRLLRAGPIVTWDETRVGYRRYGGNASGDHTRNVHETRAVWANTYFSSTNTRQDRVLLWRWWRAHQWATAHRKFAESRSLLTRRQLRRSLALAADASAHVVLPRPLRSWRLADATGEPIDLQTPIGTCERRRATMS